MLFTQFVKENPAGMDDFAGGNDDVLNADGHVLTQATARGPY
jgi:hypothetical protein